LTSALSYVYFSDSTEEYVYYGVIPGRIRFARKSVAATGYFEILPESIAKSALLCVASSRDNTHVKVYVLPDEALAYEDTLNAMEKRFFSLPNGTFFKVVSDKIVTVEIFGWGLLTQKEGRGLLRIVSSRRLKAAMSAKSLCSSLANGHPIQPHMR